MTFDACSRWLAYEALRCKPEFDALSRGLAYEALRCKPKDFIAGNFTDVQMQAEKIRQFKLYLNACECVLEDRLRERRFPHPTGNLSPVHDVIEYVTTCPVEEPENMHKDKLPTATQSPTERIENLLQSDVDNELRKRKLRKHDSAMPVDPEENEHELEDDENDGFTEKDHEDL
jgi:hypothetical protein